MKHCHRLLILVSLSTVALRVAAEDAADLVLHGGKIITMDDARPQAEAIAARGETILRVGSSREVAELIGPETRVIDLDGRVVIPGFIDSLPETEDRRARIPMGRYGKAVEVSSLIAYLASDEAAYITGQNIRIDGALTRSV